MGSLVHSRECGKAAAVFVSSFEADLVAESFKCGSRRLNLPFPSAVAKYIFYCSQRTYSYLVLVFQKSALSLPLAPAVETRATEPRFLSRCPRKRHPVRAGLPNVAATVFLDGAAEEQRSTVYTVAAVTYELRNKIKKSGTTSTYERAPGPSTAVKNRVGYSTRNGKFKRLEPHFQLSATGSASKEVTETAVALPHQREFTKEPMSALPNYGFMEKFGARAE